MERRCFCWCHVRSSRSITGEFRGVDTADAIDAALACDSCRDSHCDALLDRHMANDPAPVIREMAVWVDPPINQADGEGAE